METIKNITVKVTYTVGLGGLTAPKEVLDQLNEIADEGNEVEHGGLKYDEAQQWIIDNIKERDCFDSKFEIVDLE